MKKRMMGLLVTLCMLCAMLPSLPVQASMSINIGEYVQMGTYYGEPILWRCVDIDENGPLMLSDKILCLKAFDAAGDNTSGSHGREYFDELFRRECGSNYWGDANIRDWLNSDNETVIWTCGNPPDEDHVWYGYNDYANETGFLTNFTQSEKNAIKTVTQKSLLDSREYTSIRNENYHRYNYKIEDVLQNYDTAYSEQITDTMFLLDVKQVHSVYKNLGDYYIGLPTQQCVDNSEYKSSYLITSEGCAYWLRSPGCYEGNGAYVRSTSPNCGVGPAYDGFSGGIRPAFYLNTVSSSIQSGSGTEYAPYTIVGGSGGDTYNPTPSVNTITSSDNDVYANEMIVKANILRQNSMYKMLKDFTGVHKVYGNSFDKTLPGIYDTVNNYKTNIIKSATGITNAKNYYELVLTDILTSDVEIMSDDKKNEMLNAVIDILSNGLSDGKSWTSIYSNLDKFFGVKLDDIDKSFLKDFTGSLIDGVTDASDVTEEMLDGLESFLTLRYASDKHLLALEAIKAKTTNQELRNACSDLINYTKKAKQATVKDIKNELEQITVNGVGEKTIGFFYDNIIDELAGAVPLVKAIKTGLKAGLLIGNGVFKTDAVSGDLLTLSTLCEIDDVIKSKLWESEDDYTADPTYDNAMAFMSDAEFYKALQIYACDVGEQFAEDVRDGELRSYVGTTISAVVAVASLPTIVKRITGNGVDYDATINNIQSIKSSWKYSDLYMMNNLDIADYISINKSSDISSWATEYVNKAKSYRILPEYLQCNYRDNITRAEFCTLTTSLIEQATGKSIDDVISDKGWKIQSLYDDAMYYYVNCMSQLGIVNGLDDKTFNPLGEITRQEAAIMLKRTAAVLGLNTEVAYSTQEGDAWARSGIDYVMAKNIMTGTDNGFEPYGKYTKEQALTTLVRFYEMVR